MLLQLDGWQLSARWRLQRTKNGDSGARTDTDGGADWRFSVRAKEDLIYFEVSIRF